MNTFGILANCVVGVGTYINSGISGLYASPATIYTVPLGTYTIGTLRCINFLQTGLPVSFTVYQATASLKGNNLEPEQCTIIPNTILQWNSVYTMNIKANAGESIRVSLNSLNGCLTFHLTGTNRLIS